MYCNVVPGMMLRACLYCNISHNLVYVHIMSLLRSCSNQHLGNVVLSLESRSSVDTECNSSMDPQTRHGCEYRGNITIPGIFETATSAGYCIGFSVPLATTVIIMY